MDAGEEENIHNIDSELKLLKEKKEKLEKLSSQLSKFKTQQKKPENQIRDIRDDKTKKNYPNNEKLVLSKQEILDFCDRVISKWENDSSKDSRHIFAMNAVKTSILWTEEDTIKEIWSEIIYWIYELLYKNAIAQGNHENLEWSKIMEQINDNL